MTNREPWRVSTKNGLDSQEFGTLLSKEFDRVSITHDLPVSTRIALWAYEQADAVGGLTWVEGKALVPLESDWEQALKTMAR